MNVAAYHETMLIQCMHLAFDLRPAIRPGDAVQGHRRVILVEEALCAFLNYRMLRDEAREEGEKFREESRRPGHLWGMR